MTELDEDEPRAERPGEDARSIRERPVHPIERVAEKTARDPELLRRWIAAIERKGQAILCGPPGSGKSFLARELARHLVGGGDGFSRQLVLHAASSYEDFVQGYRPQVRVDGTVTWPLHRGRLVLFAEEAARRTGRCVLVLEEMQRANVANVLGELVHLLEQRGEPIPLAAGETPFLLPENVRVIGTLSNEGPAPGIDAVLRRRFAFLRVTADPEVLRRFHDTTGFAVEPLVALLAKIDAAIGDPDKSVGITPFLRTTLAAELEDIWRFEVEPTLELHLRHKPDELARFRWDVVGRKLRP